MSHRSGLSGSGCLTGAFIRQAQNSGFGPQSIFTRRFPQTAPTHCGLKPGPRSTTRPPAVTAFSRRASSFQGEQANLGQGGSWRCAPPGVASGRAGSWWVREWRRCRPWPAPGLHPVRRLRRPSRVRWVRRLHRVRRVHRSSSGSPSARSVRLRPLAGLLPVRALRFVPVGLARGLGCRLVADLVRRLRVICQGLCDLVAEFAHQPALQLR